MWLYAIPLYVPLSLISLRIVSNSRIAHRSCQICRKSSAVKSASSSAAVFWYALTAISEKWITSRASTFSGSMIIDLGISPGSWFLVGGLEDRLAQRFGHGRVGEYYLRRRGCAHFRLDHGGGSHDEFAR